MDCGSEERVSADHRTSVTVPQEAARLVPWLIHQYQFSNPTSGRQKQGDKNRATKTESLRQKQGDKSRATKTVNLGDKRPCIDWRSSQISPSPLSGLIHIPSCLHILLIPDEKHNTPHEQHGGALRKHGWPPCSLAMNPGFGSFHFFNTHPR